MLEALMLHSLRTILSTGVLSFILISSYRIIKNRKNEDKQVAVQIGETLIASTVLICSLSLAILFIASTVSMKTVNIDEVTVSPNNKVVQVKTKEGSYKLNYHQYEDYFKGGKKYVLHIPKNKKYAKALQEDKVIGLNFVEVYPSEEKEDKTIKYDAKD